MEARRLLGQPDGGDAARSLVRRTFCGGVVFDVEPAATTVATRCYDEYPDDSVSSQLPGLAVRQSRCPDRTVARPLRLALACRPSHEAANALYQSLGYERRDTNVYRFRLDK